MTRCLTEKLLEYALANRDHRIALFDARSGELQELRFDLLEEPCPPAAPWLVALFLGLLAGFLLGWWAKHSEIL